MIDLLAAIAVDFVGAISPKFKEDTRRSLAQARRDDEHRQARHTAMEVQLDTAMDLAIAGTDQFLLESDPKLFNRNRKRRGLPPMAA